MVTEFDFEDLYNRTFGSKPYKVPELSKSGTSESPFVIQGQRNVYSQQNGSTLSMEHEGVEIWLPTWFRGLPPNIGVNGSLLLPYSVIRISGKKTIIRTPMRDRRGTVKELYNIDDFDISIKGFLIDKEKRIWPEKHIKELQMIFETNQSVFLDNALTNIFLNKDDQVCIESLEMPEVEGGRKHVRPFSMNIVSDIPFILELMEE